MIKRLWNLKLWIGCCILFDIVILVRSYILYSELLIIVLELQRGFLVFKPTESFVLDYCFTPWVSLSSLVLINGFSLESERQQILGTLNSILADLNNAAIWMASIFL